MKNIKIICAFVLILSVFSTVLLTSCGKQESFVPVSVTTTSPQTTEAETFIYRELDIFGAKMGMSLEETQQAIGAPVELYTNESNTMYFVVNKKDLPFVNRDLEASVYFIFNEKARLAEVQYISTEQTGFALKDAITAYDRQYGKHAELQVDATKHNYIWFKDGVYIVITTVTDGQNAMSFFDKDYFEKNHAEEAQAYNA